MVMEGIKRRYQYVGIAMAELIRSDIRHISNAANNEDSYRVLRGRVSVLKIAPDARFMPYLELAEFGSVALIRSSDLRFDLLSALVERWRPETHTFHFPCGECTVTLEDVAVQLGLSVDGNPVTGLSSLTDPAAGTTHARCKRRRCAFVDLPRCRFVHARSYSWGSAILAMLYKELCQATDPQCKDIGGCLILLQSWALYRMPFLARVSHQPYLYPLSLRWTTRPGIGKSCDVPIYRMRIEQHAREGFIWMPYRRPEITNVVPPSALVDSHTWCTNTPIINFNIVEWYNGDRVLRQFGCIQHIPDPPCQLGDDHGLTKRGRVQLDWGIYHWKYVALWYDRLRRIPQIVMATDLQPSAQYIEWYHSRGKPYLLGARTFSKLGDRKQTARWIRIRRHIVLRNRQSPNS
ncbi:serine/threonine-protein phosphatase 7 long form homolog [Gossypium raimondii]|uniref:serine/threonine-protein phosphatase 7 long form homolog n=1 Tax=Gossypium raimondii TaxID=29730 RepID=UPI00227B2796|nr:serine/threonine-protein phosphatase 7 long form homolog [Gossypium raimondii]